MRDLEERLRRLDVDRDHSVHHLVGFHRELVVADVLRVAISECTVVAFTPAQHGPVGPVRARRLRAGVEPSHGAAEPRGADGARQFVVADRGAVAIPELAMRAPTPALDAAVVENRAGVISAARQRDHGTAHVDIAGQGFQDSDHYDNPDPPDVRPNWPFTRTVDSDLGTVPITIQIKDGDLWVWDAKGNGAKITIKNVMQSNGVIHVIDTVLLPS